MLTFKVVTRRNEYTHIGVFLGKKAGGNNSRRSTYPGRFCIGRNSRYIFSDVLLIFEDVSRDIDTAMMHLI